MTNLSFDEVRKIPKIKTISDYENKSKENLIKALSETKPEPDTNTKLEIPKPDTKPKPKTPKPDRKPNQK